MRSRFSTADPVVARPGPILRKIRRAIEFYPEGRTGWQDGGMKGIRAAAIVLLLSGCAGSGDRRADEIRLRALDAADRVQREQAFQDLLRGEGAPIPLLRAAV